MLTIIPLLLRIITALNISFMMYVYKKLVNILTSYFISKISNPKLSNSVFSRGFNFLTHHTKTYFGLEDAT